MVLKDVPAGATAVGVPARNIVKASESQAIIDISQRKGIKRKIYNDQYLLLLHGDLA